MYKIDRPAADRTVALVAKVPKSGRSCNTLHELAFPRGGTGEKEERKKEASRGSAKCEKAERGPRRRRGVRDKGESAEERVPLELRK